MSWFLILTQPDPLCNSPRIGTWALKGSRSTRFTCTPDGMPSVRTAHHKFGPLRECFPVLVHLSKIQVHMKSSLLATEFPTLPIIRCQRSSTSSLIVDMSGSTLCWWEMPQPSSECCESQQRLIVIEEPCPRRFLLRFGYEINASSIWYANFGFDSPNPSIFNLVQ